MLKFMIRLSEVDNFDIFRDCLSTTIISRLAPESGKAARKVKGRKNEIKPVRAVAPESENGSNDVAELADFIEVRTSHSPAK